MLELKLIAAIAIFGAGVGGAWLARRFAESSRAASITTLANGFAGGVFLGAALIHMLPDAQSTFASTGVGGDYPLFALIAGLGFTLVLLLDKVLMAEGRIERVDDKPAIYPYLLMLTLSIHSVITGMALGFETQLASAAAIIVAVLAHKSTASMALAISFMRGNIPSPTRSRLLWLFFIMAPAGVLIGTWWSSALSGSGEIYEASFDALASGTFLYIAIMDILSEEFAATRDRWPLFWCTTAGFAVMALVAIWT